MKRNISKKMNREEVIASMASKLAEGSVVNAKKKFHHKILLINLAVILLSGTMVLIVTISISKNLCTRIIMTLSAGYLCNAEPFTEIKKAFQDEVIGADEYALHMAYLLVKYDSIPENFKTPSPKIMSKEVYAELDRIWEVSVCGCKRYF